MNLALGTVVIEQSAPDVLRIHALYADCPERVASHANHLAALADAALVAHRTADRNS